MLRANLLIVALLAGVAHAAPAKLDTQAIEAGTGLKGKLDDKEGAFKVSAPRKDLQVVAGGVKMVRRRG
jgi:hypothetical protein